MEAKVVIIGICHHNTTTLSQVQNLACFQDSEPLIFNLTDLDNEYKYTKEELQQLPQKVKHRKKRKFHD